ncbi:MAG: rhodanese-related sulfurtransferase [Gammaproteobacteria bacterium]|jgi:rhodanese-related sulfurtransferase
MSQLSEFAANHLILVSAFSFVLALLIVNLLQGGGSRAILPIQAVQLLNREDAVIVDIRDEGEFNDGHIINAHHIPRADLKSRIDELKKFKDRPIVVCCASGSSSAPALRELNSAGFGTVHSLKGGIAAWRADNLPLT